MFRVGRIVNPRLARSQAIGSVPAIPDAVESCSSLQPKETPAYCTSPVGMVKGGVVMGGIAIEVSGLLAALPFVVVSPVVNAVSAVTGSGEPTPIPTATVSATISNTDPAPTLADSLFN